MVNMVVVRPLLLAAEVRVRGKKFTVVKLEFVFLALRDFTPLRTARISLEMTIFGLKVTVKSGLDKII